MSNDFITWRMASVESVLLPGPVEVKQTTRPRRTKSSTQLTYDFHDNGPDASCYGWKHVEGDGMGSFINHITGSSAVTAKSKRNSDIRIRTQIVSVQALHYLTLSILIPPLLWFFAEPNALMFEGGPANVGEFV